MEVSRRLLLVIAVGNDKMVPQHVLDFPSLEHQKCHENNTARLISISCQLMKGFFLPLPLL